MNPILFYEYGKRRATLQMYGGRVFESTWDTRNTLAGSSAANQIRIPFLGIGGFDVTVDWGDSTPIQNVTSTGAMIHTYAVTGVYTIKITSLTGIITGLLFNGGVERSKILSIKTWGCLRLGTTQGSYFYLCGNLKLNEVTDVLDLTGTTSLAQTFYRVPLPLGINRIGEWDVSQVQDFTGMFAQSSSTTSFNNDISGWNMSSATKLNSMFQYNKSFNQPIGNWERVGSTLANVTDMTNMFYTEWAFDQNIGNWNVSNVLSFAGFMTAKTISTGFAPYSPANLDALYIGWASRPVKPNITITFGAAKRTAASTAARAILTGAPNNWIITDGGI